MIEQVVQGAQQASMSTRDLLFHFGKLVDLHIQLMSEELSIQRARLITGVALVGIGLISTLCATLIGSIALIYFIAEHSATLSVAESALLLCGGWIILALSLLYFSYRLFHRLTLVPHVAINSIKESFQCLTTRR